MCVCVVWCGCGQLEEMVVDGRCSAMWSFWQLGASGEKYCIGDRLKED